MTQQMKSNNIDKLEFFYMCLERHFSTICVIVNAIFKKMI